MAGLLYSLLLITGSLAAALAAGLAVVHWAAGVRPFLDAGGWIIAAYGLAALAACSILDRDTAGYTILLVVLAVFSAFVAGRRTCPMLLLVETPGSDEP